MKPPSILFINRVYPPDTGATGQLLADLAATLAQRGHDVTVLTSGAVFAAPRSEVRDGVRVERVTGAAFTRASHWRRALSYLSLYPAFLLRAWRLPRTDVVVTMTDPPLLAVLGLLLQVLKGSKHIHWAQDLYPELAEELSVLPRGGWIARALRALSTAALRRADRVVAVGRCMKARLVGRGLPAESVLVIPNWGHSGNADCRLRIADSRSGLLPGERFRREHELSDRFVIMYSGNLGLAHPFEAMLDAARELQTSCPAALLLFVGDGPRLAWVKDQVMRRQLENVRFLPFQPREQLGESLAAANLHLASMLPELCGLVVPSKVCGIAAAGRPCIFLGPAGSEAAHFLVTNECGEVLPDATGAGLAACLQRWMSEPSRLHDAGERAATAAAHIELQQAASAFSNVVRRACGQPETKLPEAREPERLSLRGHTPVSPPLVAP